MILVTHPGYSNCIVRPDSEHEVTVGATVGVDVTVAVDVLVAVAVSVGVDVRVAVGCVAGVNVGVALLADVGGGLFVPPPPLPPLRRRRSSSSLNIGVALGGIVAVIVGEMVGAGGEIGVAVGRRVGKGGAGVNVKVGTGEGEGVDVEVAVADIGSGLIKAESNCPGLSGVGVAVASGELSGVGEKVAICARGEGVITISDTPTVAVGDAVRSGMPITGVDCPGTEAVAEPVAEEPGVFRESISDSAVTQPVVRSATVPTSITVKKIWFIANSVSCEIHSPEYIL